MKGRRLLRPMGAGATVLRHSARGAAKGASKTARGAGTGAAGAARGAGGVARGAARGGMLVGAAATGTGAATLRAARRTRRSGRRTGGEAARRARAVVSAARGERQRLWPSALGALGIGLGMGVASGVAAGRRRRNDPDGEARSEDGPAGDADRGQRAGQVDLDAAGQSPNRRAAGHGRARSA